MTVSWRRDAIATETVDKIWELFEKILRKIASNEIGEETTMANLLA